MKPDGQQEVVSRRKKCESDKKRMFTHGTSEGFGAVRAMYDLEKRI